MGQHWRGRACLEGTLSKAISEVPKSGSQGLGGRPSRKDSVLPTSQSQIFQTGSAGDSTSPELTPRELRRGNLGREALTCVW